MQTGKSFWPSPTCVIFLVPCEGIYQLDRQVRFGSKADIAPPRFNVCSYPDRLTTVVTPKADVGRQPFDVHFEPEPDIWMKDVQSAHNDNIQIAKRPLLGSQLTEIKARA
jgi:hypothetical protein